MVETQNVDIDIGNINPHLRGLEQDFITLDCIQVRTKDFLASPREGQVTGEFLSKCLSEICFMVLPLGLKRTLNSL